MERYQIDHRNLLDLISNKESLTSKYLQIKSLERSLLEYLIFKNSNQDNKTYQQLTNASEFIHDYMPIKTSVSQPMIFNYQMFYALGTLQAILNSGANSLSEITEVSAYKSFFMNEKFNYSYA